MIDISVYNRYNFIEFENGKNVIKNDFRIHGILNTLLDSLNIEKINSEFSTDFDFFINIETDKSAPQKKKFYGKPIYQLSDIITFFLKRRSDKLGVPYLTEDIIPMIQSKDSDTIILGYSLLLRDLSYSDVQVINFLVDKHIYPYDRTLRFTYYKREIFNAFKEFWPLLHCAWMLYCYRDKEPLLV